MTGADFGWLVLFGTTQFGLGQLLLTIGLRSVSATRSALIGSLEVPLAPAIVWVVLGEVPAVMTGVGGAIVLGAVSWDLFAAQYGAQCRHGASSATD